MTMATCRYCKTNDLQWAATEQGWRLVTATRQVHLCRLRKQTKAERHEGLRRAFTEGAFKLQPKLFEAFDDTYYTLPCWSFLDAQPEKKGTLKEIIP